MRDEDDLDILRKIASARDIVRAFTQKISVILLIDP